MRGTSPSLGASVSLDGGADAAFWRAPLGAKPWRREGLGSHACRGGAAIHFGVCVFVFRRYRRAGVCINITRVRQTTRVPCLTRGQSLTRCFPAGAMHIY